MITLPYKNFEVQLFDAQGNSSDIKFDVKYQSEESQVIPSSILGIKVIQDGNIFHSVLVEGTWGATAVHKSSYLIDYDCLFACVSNSVFNFSLPDLQLKWKTKIDEFTCFQIFKIIDGYIIHGELNISKIDFHGNIVWQFSGRDIFVTDNNESAFEIRDGLIFARDWDGHEYKLDFNGKLLGENQRLKK